MMRHKRLLAMIMAGMMVLSQKTILIADEWSETEEAIGTGADFEEPAEDDFYEDDQWNETLVDGILQDAPSDDNVYDEALFEKECIEATTESDDDFSEDLVIIDETEEVAEEEFELLAANTDTSGSCGDDLTWTLDSNGVLTINGSGEMYDFDNGWEPSDDSPFYHRSDISSVIIKPGVTSIGAWAFCRCTNLTSITIPSSVTSIESCAFWECTSLTSITIPSSVTSIGGWAFGECTNLMSITIPSSVTSIDEDAFQNCDQLTIYSDTGSYAEIYANENGIPFVASGGSDIPSDAGLYNGHYYYVFNLEKDWAQANAYCESRGGYLATITSQEENEFIFKYMKDSGFTSAYFGFTDEITEGEWRWVTGEPVVYTNWASGEPNSENSNEDYAMFYYKFTTGKWNDGNFGINAAGNTTAFICEWGDIDSAPANYEFLHSLDYYATTSSSEYNPELALDLMKMAWDAYGPNTVHNEHNVGTDEEIRADYAELGFDVDNNYYSKNYDKWTYFPDYCGFSFAVKDAADGGRIVAITIRGTVGEITKFDPEWASNILNAVPPLHVAGWHNGFYTPACEILNSLIEKGLIDTANTKYFITGHSRGAGVGNVLAVLLSQIGVSRENLYDYNFACPDTMYAHLATDWSGGGRYNNIFNINAANDLVGVIPGILGDVLEMLARGVRVCAWGKYGRTYFYSFNWDSIESSTVITFFTEQGERNPHESWLYFAYLTKKNTTSSFKSYAEVKRQNAKCICGFCPVDMTIVDGNGAAIAAVKNGDVIYYNNYGMGDALVMTDGDFKAFFVDPSIDFKVKIEATDNGEMAFVSGLADMSTGEFECEKHFENVKLEKGKAFLSEGLSQTSADNVKLYTIDAGGNRIAEVNSNGTETAISKPVSPQIKPVSPQSNTAAEKITISKKPAIKKPAAAKNKITVKWKHFKHMSKKTKKIWKSIKKVQVQCAADKAFTNIVKSAMIKKSKTKAVIKGLNRNTVYYVRVRYYDGTGYSAWSKVKKIKTKK